MVKSSTHCGRDGKGVLVSLELGMNIGGRIWALVV